MQLLGTDILDDEKQKYYLTIDRLDENWINDDLRYRLIRALLVLQRKVAEGWSPLQLALSMRTISRMIASLIVPNQM